MNKRDLRNFIQISAIIVFTIIFGHSLVNVLANFGVTFLTISYLVSLAIFYVFLYIVKFVISDPQKQNINSDKIASNAKDALKSLARVQVIILLINLFLSAYEHHYKAQDIDLDNAVAAAFEDFFIAFPDYIIQMMINIIDRL